MYEAFLTNRKQHILQAYAQKTTTCTEYFAEIQVPRKLLSFLIPNSWCSRIYIPVSMGGISIHWRRVVGKKTRWTMAL